MGIETRKLALFFTGGISLQIWEKIGNLEREIKYYNHLAKHFEKIYFVTYGTKEELKFKEKLEKNIEILPKRFWFLPSKIYQLFIPLIYSKELRDTDFVKTNQMKAALAAILSKWFFKKKLIVRCGYEWLKVMEKEKKSMIKRCLVFFLEKIAYKNANKIIVTSIEVKRFIEKKFEIPSLQIEIIPNYIDISIFRPINLEKEKNRICFVGRLSREKNLFNLIKAISGLSVKLTIFGSGPLKNDLEELAKKQNSQVEFLGNIPNNRLPEELNKSELFILPSLYEANPKALLESMACGLPSVGANVEGIKETIQHRKNGYICEPDETSIKKAILTVLENKTLHEKIGQNARETIMKHFSLEKILKKEIEIYKAL